MKLDKDILDEVAWRTLLLFLKGAVTFVGARTLIVHPLAYTGEERFHYYLLVILTLQIVSYAEGWRCGQNKLRQDQLKKELESMGVSADYPAIWEPNGRGGFVVSRHPNAPKPPPPPPPDKES